MWECVDCGEEIQGPNDDYPDGWTMDEDGNEICERCQDNYIHATLVVEWLREMERMDRMVGRKMTNNGWNCETCATNIRIGRERLREAEEKQDVGDNETKEGGASHKKKRTRRKTPKKKKQSRKSKNDKFIIII